MNLNGMQIALIISAVLAGLTGAAAQLTDIFGPTVGKEIVSAAALINLILSSVLVPFTSQRSQVQSVAAMSGVERITVNSGANQTLAQLATDPAQEKVSPMQGSTLAVTNTAKGA
jgi:hypothetical protein